MTFLGWMNMNMILDISFLVFAAASVWKIRKLEKNLLSLKNDLLLTMRNPSAAKRKLKQRK
ncbi:MAG: hypothetical protein CBD16_03365 [Betaproteobacteria bacterium TMED156]|nr:MAG: hypothetical protein CBD16_03365 [Betaproteobacteria bacterium TMED156]|tara:strand:- start:415 stop:597 length:183 start_codon:yes stop_codon:yes gene_type:complete